MSVNLSCSEVGMSQNLLQDKEKLLGLNSLETEIEFVFGEYAKE